MSFNVLKFLVGRTTPTRETIVTSTLLDHVAVSNAINIVESGVYRVALSDHYLVYAVRNSVVR